MAYIGIQLNCPRNSFRNEIAKGCMNKSYILIRGGLVRFFSKKKVQNYIKIHYGYPVMLNQFNNEL